jgi:hypothetical protein
MNGIHAVKNSKRGKKDCARKIPVEEEEEEEDETPLTEPMPPSERGRRGGIFIAMRLACRSSATPR